MLTFIQYMTKTKYFACVRSSDQQTSDPFLGAYMFTKRWISLSRESKLNSMMRLESFRILWLG